MSKNIPYQIKRYHDNSNELNSYDNKTAVEGTAPDILYNISKCISHIILRFHGVIILGSIIVYGGLITL